MADKHNVETGNDSGMPKRSRRRVTAPTGAPSVEQPVAEQAASQPVTVVPNQSDAVVFEAPQPRRTRRRAVSAPAGPPRAVETVQSGHKTEVKSVDAIKREQPVKTDKRTVQAELDNSAMSEGANVAEAPVAEEVAAERKPRNRRLRTRKKRNNETPLAVEAESTEDVSQPVEGKATVTETAVEGADVKNTGEKRTRRRSTKRRENDADHSVENEPKDESVVSDDAKAVRKVGNENPELPAVSAQPMFVQPKAVDQALDTDSKDSRSAILDDLASLAEHRKPEAESERPKVAEIDFASLLFQAPEPAPVRVVTESEADDDADEDGEDGSNSRRRRRRGGRGRRGRGRNEENENVEESAVDTSTDADNENEDEANDGTSTRRRRRRRRSGTADDTVPAPDDPPNTVVKVREGRDEVRALKGSTRLEAKKQRRREGRDAGRRKTSITEAEFLARRESVKRSMVVREAAGRTQIAVLEDDVLVEHYVAQKSQNSMVGNVYLGKVQNVLPSMEAAFVDIGKGRNAVLYAGEVNWDAAGLDGQPRRIELALKSGDSVLVQVTKDPIGQKGARLTSQVSLPGRYLVYVPGGSMTGISRKLPDNERARLKKIMRQVIPEGAGVIVRTAAEGASEEELTNDVERLRKEWERILKAEKTKSAPASLSQEPDLAIKVVRDVFNEDFSSLTVQGDKAYQAVEEYISSVAPDLADRVSKHVGEKDIFAKYRIDEQLLKAMDRKVYLPSGGSLVIDRTEAMTVIDVNTGKFTGSGGSLEETVTKNNLEAAEEIVRQLRLRDIGGIIVVDFIDMVLEANRDLVLRRLVECLSRDRTKHQVAEVTSLGLVQMTRKRVGQGLVEVFSQSCEACNGRGVLIDISDPKPEHGHKHDNLRENKRARKSAKKKRFSAAEVVEDLIDSKNGADVQVLAEDDKAREVARATIASIAAAATHQHETPEVRVDGEVVKVDSETKEQPKE